MKAFAITETTAAKLKLIGGRLCLDFTNTVGGRKTGRSGKISVLDEKLRNYPDLVAWSEHTGILEAAQARHLLRESKRHNRAAAAVLRRAVSLRETVYRIFKAIVAGAQPDPADLDALNNEVAEARPRERLALVRRQVIWQWIDDRNALDRMLWPVALSAADLLTSGDLNRMRECGGKNCGWLFVDASRNRSRHWCYMEGCGNLAKVRRYRQRHRKASTA